MIIIEGMDNTGKSTLIQTLLNVFPMLKVGKMDNAPNATEDQYRDFVWNVLGKTDRQTQFLIFDRLLFSEVVYGPIVRGKIRLMDSEVVAAFRLLANHRPLLIYCQRTEEQIRQTFGEREQMSGVEANVSSLLQAYEGWLNSWKGKLIRYDFDNPRGLTEVVGAVADYIRKVYDLETRYGEVMD